MWNANTDEAYNTKFAMAMLTGELPDLLVLNQKQFRELQASGKLADLTDYYENNIYPYLREKVLEAQPEAAQQAAFVDGRRYALTTSGFGTVSRSIFIRHDYREAVGAELPTTMEELIDLGKAFADQRFRSLTVTFLMLASEEPSISQEPITSHSATRFFSRNSFFCGTVSGTSSLNTLARTFQKRFCGWP